MILVLVGIAILAVGLAPAAWALKRSPQRVAPVHLVPASAGLFFGLPPLVYAVITGTGMRHVLPGGPGVVWSAVLSIVVFVVVSAIASTLLGRGHRYATVVASTIPSLARVTAVQVIGVALLVWAVRGFLAVRYGVFYAGYVPRQAVPYLLTILTHLCDLLAIALLFWSVWTLATAAQRTRKALAIGLLVLQALYVFAQGRREMFFFAVLCGLVYLYSALRFSWKYAAAAALGVLVLALAAFPLYQATRQLVGERYGSRRHRLSVSAYYRSVLDAGDRGDVASLYRRNLASRLSLYYRWQVDLASMRDQAGGLHGGLTLSGLTYAVPRFLLANKYAIPWGEEVVQRAYGGSGQDAPNSVVAAGFADFGALGAGIYAFVFVALIWAWSRAGTWVARRSPLFGLALLGGVMLLALRTEITMVGVFSSLRDLALFGTIAAGISIVVRSYRSRVFGRVSI